MPPLHRGSSQRLRWQGLGSHFHPRGTHASSGPETTNGLAALAHSKDRRTRRQPWSPSSSSPRPALGVGSCTPRIPVLEA